MDGDRGQELPIHPFPPLSYFGNVLVPCALFSFRDSHLVLITVGFSFQHMLLLKNVYPLINYKPNLAVVFQINFYWNTITSTCLPGFLGCFLIVRKKYDREEVTFVIWLFAKKLKKYFKSLKIVFFFKSGTEIYLVKIELNLILAQKVLHILIPIIRLLVGIF